MEILTHPVWGPVILIGVFVVASVLGYIIIRKVPSLLHTPLMSGMNALSGVTVLGALSATGGALLAQQSGSRVVAIVLGVIAIFLAMLNVAGGFGVTHRMLRMFRHRDGNKGGKGETS